MEQEAIQLTLKQKAFARKYIELGNASEAYRQAYDAKNMSNEAIKVEACRLLQNPNVALTVVNLQQKHSERHMVTVDSLTKELTEDRALAYQVENPSAAISATMGKAKIHGFLVDKAEIGNKDGKPFETKEVSLMEKARVVAHILSEAKRQKDKQEK